MAANGDYLLHYLLTRTSTPPAQAEAMAEQMSMYMQIAHDLAEGYCQTYPHLALMQRYYDGYPPLPREPRRMTEKFRELLLAARSNWCGLVVDVVDERLKVGSIGSSSNAVQDKQLWSWWQANNLDGGSQQIHSTALRLGLCYISAWPKGPYGAPKIMGESPLTTYADFDLETDECIGAIRFQYSPREGVCYADLTLPDIQLRLVSAEVKPSTAIDPWDRWAYEAIDVANVEWQLRDDVEPISVNSMGVVPYVRMRTMPDLNGGYRSEIDGIRPIQDRINRTNFDRLVTQEYAAFPQRWATGIELPVDPETGQPQNPFSGAQDRMWTAEDENVKFGQFDVADLNNYLQAVTADTQALATQSRTPPHYLVAGMGQFPSGESVRATEYGLTRKIQARQQSYGDSWADVLRLAAKAAGKPRLAVDQNIRVIWENVEARSEGEIVDALLKMATLQVPLPVLWQRWGASPSEITDWQKQLEAQAQADAEQAALTAPPEPDIQPAPALPAVPSNVE